MHSSHPLSSVLQCDIEHNLDNWGKGKGIRFVSDELTLETRRALILYRDGLRLDIDEPQAVGAKKAARKPRQQKGKQVTLSLNTPC